MRLNCTVISRRLFVPGGTGPGTQEMEPVNKQPRDSSRDNPAPSQGAVTPTERVGALRGSLGRGFPQS